MSQELDISWQTLRRIAQDWGGDAAELSEVTPLDGGAISTTIALKLADGRQAVCKISAHRVDRSYVNEAHQLKLLAEAGLPAPRVYATRLGSLEDPFSYILMEFVDGVNLQQARRACTEEQFADLQAHLAQLLLALHEHTAEGYGRVEIDPPAPTFADWPTFFRRVFDPICDDTLKSNLIPGKCRRQIGKVLERLDLLVRHDDVPRLVHWDVWSTNILARPDESGNWRVAALLDPNCKYAHAEAELAYLSLFQTATPAFLKAYQQKRKLGEDYHRVRKPVYQVFFLLNHVNLFGSGYVQPLEAAVQRLSGLI
ncbi:MAG: fructosamine kinase family protein [Tepidisphaeraceae bacterium]|jgi:fructosamine-3-kinase